jgi:hypothetical protein
MGAFDDLIPEKAPAAAGGGGTFDDLIPQSKEQQLRVQYGKDIAKHGEPGYGERFIDDATFGAIRPLSGLTRVIGGLGDPSSTAGERWRAGVGAAGDYFKKGEENTAGLGGFATDVAGAVAAPPIGKAVALPGMAARYIGEKIAPSVAKIAPSVATKLVPAAQTGGRELLGKIIPQAAFTGGVEGAARNAEDVGSALGGAASGAALGSAAAGAVGTALKPFMGKATDAVRLANQGMTPEEVKAGARPLFKMLDQGGISYGQPQTLPLKAGIDDLIANNQYNPIAHQRISGFVDELAQKAQRPQGMGFNELSNLRSALAEQARGPDESTRGAARKVIEKIDDLILNNKPATAPPGIDVGAVHSKARELWKAASIADDVGYTAGRAERKAASQAGVNPDEANRAAFRPMYEQTLKPGAYSPFDAEQRQMLAKIVRGDTGQNLYRAAGAAAGSPATKWIVGALGAAAGLNPIAGGLAGAGASQIGGGFAKRYFDQQAANRGAENIDALIRNITGSQRKDIPADAMRTLLAKQQAQRAAAAGAGNILGD